MKPVLVLGHFDPKRREAEMALHLLKVIRLTRGSFR